MLFSIYFPIFGFKFKLLNMDKKKLNRLKLVLVEKDKTGVWLAEQLGVTAVTVSKWCSNTMGTIFRITSVISF